MLEFERSVLTFDLLMLLFSDPQYQKIEKKSAENLCEDFGEDNHRDNLPDKKIEILGPSKFSRSEKGFIQNICTPGGKLRKIYTQQTSGTFLNPSNELAKKQVTAELNSYHKCFNDNVKEETFLHDFKAFVAFLNKDVISVIYDYGYGVYSIVKGKIEKISTVRLSPRAIAPVSYDSQISNWIWPAKHTEGSGISESIKAFLGQSLFFTYAVPKLLTFLPSEFNKAILSLKCAGDPLLDKRNTLEQCQDTRNSGLSIKGSYLYAYMVSMSSLDKDNGNLFSFLYYMLANCNYSDVDPLKIGIVDTFISFQFFPAEAKEFIDLFVTSFEYYKDSAIFSKDTVCGKVISKIEDGHQYLYALVRLIALHRHHEFQKVTFDCKGPGTPPFLQLHHLCYLPQHPKYSKLPAKM
eukprot:Nk52_evm4s48 gene=Nk52_evmTU4s48